LTFSARASARPPDDGRLTDLKAAAFADKMRLQGGDIVSKINNPQVSKLDDARRNRSDPPDGQPLQADLTRRGEAPTIYLRR
jgi:S1-C subfamily serine protease